jgi:phosphoribosylaminoimidazole-succinocarboxamide synthase
MVVRSLRMIPVEVVVRAYLTGTTSTSIWAKYQGGERSFGGIVLPDGLRKNGPLPEPIITPTSKAPVGEHDVPVGEREIVASGLCSASHWERIKAASLAVFAYSQHLCADRGLLLVDTKYEFGLDDTGGVVLADEMHTPDSSRLWLASSYAGRLSAGEEPEMLDKEYLRLWIASRCRPYQEPIPPIPEEVRDELSARYVKACEMITGERLVATAGMGDPMTRIRANLSRAFPVYFR